MLMKYQGLIVAIPYKPIVFMMRNIQFHICGTSMTFSEGKSLDSTGILNSFYLEIPLTDPCN